MRLIEAVIEEREEMESKFGPLEEQFAILDKCEVNYTNEVAIRLANLPTDWAQFQETVVNCEEVSSLIPLVLVPIPK